MKRLFGIVRAGGLGEAPGFLFQNFLPMPSVLAAMTVQGLGWIAGGVGNQVWVSNHWLHDLLTQAFCLLPRANGSAMITRIPGTQRCYSPHRGLSWTVCT